MKARRGWTLIEMLIVLAILGILATVALPYYWEARHRALGARVVSDYNILRVSALSYHASTNQLPSSQSWGVVPPEMKPTLPDSFSFVRENHDYRWQLWPGSSLGGDFAASDLVAGMSIRSTDARLIQAIRRTFQGRFLAATPAEVTLLIQ